MLASRTEAHKFYADFLRQSEERGEVKPAMAELGRRDLFFLLYHILKRRDVDVHDKSDWLYDRVRMVQLQPDGFLDLWARFHYKSTIITFAKTIQDIINNPELVIGIFSHTRPIAKAFLRQIKVEAETNPLLYELYSDIFWENPKKESPKWSEDDGLVFKRKGNPKESTIEAWGLVDGQPTSKHYNVRVYDDIVTRESVQTPEAIEKTTNAWALSLNLGTRGGTSRYAGTRYHAADTYKTIMQREAAIPRIFPATDTGKGEGEPVLLTRQENEQHRREMGPYVYGCQMLQDPKADSVQGFLEKWLKYWQRHSWDRMNLYLFVDPANEKKKTSDWSVFWLIGLGSDRNYYDVFKVRDRLNLTERTRMLFRIHQDYHPKEVFYEKYGMQSDIQHIEAEMKRHNYRFNITEVGGNTPKPDRIRRLIPIFENRRFYLAQRDPYVNFENEARDLTQDFINVEYLDFPVCQYDDMLDCVARTQDPEAIKRMVWPKAQPIGGIQTKADDGMGSELGT